MTIEEVVEKVKVDYEVILNSFIQIDEQEVCKYDEINIFRLNNNLILFSDDWYDISYDY